MIDWARDEGGDVTLTDDAEEAVKGTDCVVTDTWVSMGQADATRRKQLLGPYAVDDAPDEAGGQGRGVHALPARPIAAMRCRRRVIDGPQSVVFDEAENRLHAQKAILAWCLGRLMDRFTDAR